MAHQSKFNLKQTFCAQLCATTIPPEQLQRGALRFSRPTAQRLARSSTIYFALLRRLFDAASLQSILQGRWVADRNNYQLLLRRGERGFTNAYIWAALFACRAAEKGVISAHKNRHKRTFENTTKHNSRREFPFPPRKALTRSGNLGRAAAAQATQKTPAWERPDKLPRR